MAWFAKTWNPWREIEEIQREMNRLFAGRRTGNQSAAGGLPAFNVWRNEEGIALTSELPGFGADELEISVVGRTVTVTGKRAPEQSGEGDRWYRRERSLESFVRTIDLPYEVDPSSAEASYEKGVLTIRLTRPEEQKPRKVVVKAN